MFDRLYTYVVDNNNLSVDWRRADGHSLSA